VLEGIGGIGDLDVLLGGTIGGEIFLGWTMLIGFEDGLGLNGLELGLEGDSGLGGSGGVGATARVGEIEAKIFDFVAGDAPIALSTTFLLYLARVGVGKAMLGKVLREMLLNGLGITGVIAVVELVGASHDERI